MSRKVSGLSWVLVFVVLGLTLYSCAPKKPAPKPEEAETEEGIVVEEKIEKAAEKKDIVVGKKKLAVPKEGVLMAADFDTCKKPNNVGGDFGAWNKDPQDFTQGCFDSFIPTIKHGEEGCSVQIMYDVLSPNPAYNGFWMKLNGIDLAGYNKVSFWVKGDEMRGFTKVFKAELKNNKGQVGKCYVTEATSEWKKIVIPFDKFAGITDFSSMSEFVIVFEDRIATKKEGAIYIDDIAFLK